MSTLRVLLAWLWARMQGAGTRVREWWQGAPAEPIATFAALADLPETLPDEAIPFDEAVGVDGPMPSLLLATAQDRMSAMHLACPWRGPLVAAADVGFTAGNRQAGAFAYSGIPAGVVVASGITDLTTKMAFLVRDQKALLAALSSGDLTTALTKYYDGTVHPAQAARRDANTEFMTYLP